MPQFTVWNPPDPSPNVLFDPLKVNEQIAETQSKLGTLDIARQKFELDKSAIESAPGQIQSILGNTRTGGSTYPADGTGAGGGGSFLGALAQIESGDQNIVSGVDKDSKGLTLAQGGDPTEISNGHMQINGPTWRDFAPQAGVDLNLYPYAMKAPRDIQMRVASIIPFNRFGPRTRTLMHQRFGDFDESQPVGVLAGLGPRLGPRVAQLPGTPGGAVAVTPEADQAAVRDAGAKLLAMPEDQAAAAYPGIVRDLQARGFAMRAPPVYPGHAAVQTMVGGPSLPVPPIPPANPPPPFNPNAGPRIGNLPATSPDVTTQTGAADLLNPPVDPSRIALRLGGADVAGPGAPTTPASPGPDTGSPLSISAANQLLQGLPFASRASPLAPADVGGGGPATASSPSWTGPATPPLTRPTATPGGVPGVSGAAPPQSRPPTGTASPQYQGAMDLARKAAALEMIYDPTGRAKAVAAGLRNQAQLMLQADSYTPYTQDGVQGQISALTGKFEPYPARRVTKLDDGRIINDQGQVIGFSPPYKVEQDSTGRMVFVPQYPGLPAGPGIPGVGGNAAVTPVPGSQPETGYKQEQDAEAKRLSELQTAIIDKATESEAANTMIQNTERAMAEAQKGNIGPNALAPDKLNLIATAKAMGINLAAYGIDPTKLGAAQVTREQLQQLNGAILRKMYPQRITNADLAVSGQALPNYGLDPEALIANFEIYKQQNAYDKAKALDMLAYRKEHGTLRGWEDQWFAKNGFASGPLDTLFRDAHVGALAGGGSGTTGSGSGAGAGGGDTAGPPVSALKEGVVTHFDNGQSWTLRNGQRVRTK